MKVHILQVEGGADHFEGADPASILDLHEEEVKPVSDVRYILDVGLSGGGLWAAGSVGVDMRLQCVRCLERFIYPAAVNDFACQVELTGAESVDLTASIREDILLALPAHPHCDWNGEHACPGAACPVLNEAAMPDGLLAESTEVWEALDRLNLKKSS